MKDTPSASRRRFCSGHPLPGTGWVPTDPADVRKAMLADKVELKDADKLKEFFWAGDDLFRIDRRLQRRPLR